MSVAVARPELLGARWPRVTCRPDSVGSSAVEVVELAQSVGLSLYDWQADELDRILSETAAGSWSAFETATVLARQNGKNQIIEALELGDLFLLDTRLVLHSSHEFKTTNVAFNRLLSWIESAPDLSRRVLRVTRSNGEEGIRLRSGQAIRFIARSKGSGRGFTADRLILDESYNVSTEALAALVPTLTASPNPQINYFSSAALPGPESDVLRALRARALSPDPGRLCYSEWSAAPDADLDDPAAWEAANPSLGFHVQESFIRSERAAYSDEDFARERLSVPSAAAVGSAVPMDAFHAAQDPSTVLPDAATPVFGVDAASDGVSASIAVAGVRPDHRVHVELVARRDGIGWVADEVARMIAAWGGYAVVDPSGPAGPIAVALDAAGVAVVKVVGRHQSTAAAGFVAGLRDGKIRVRPHESLTAAATAARRYDLGDGWTWRRRAAKGDIAPVVAASWAVWGLSVEPDYDLLDSIV